MSNLTKRVAERAAVDGDGRALGKLMVERCRAGECCFHAFEKPPGGAIIDLKGINFPQIIVPLADSTHYPGRAVRLDVVLEVFGTEQSDPYEILDWIRRRLAVLQPPEFVPPKPKNLTTVACRRCATQIESGNYCSPCLEYHVEQNSPYV